PASRGRTIGVVAAAGLACLAIAVPVSGAFGADDNPTNGSAAQQGQQGYGQPPSGRDQPPGNGQGRPDGNCPKGQGSDSSGAALSGDSVAS
ncbi:MAG: hypothetical protein QOE60_456, partial [Thermoleophilaceae bacterium]|nr:hypothetical protein [Thermoleophilaceae bacterium]